MSDGKAAAAMDAADEAWNRSVAAWRRKPPEEQMQLAQGALSQIEMLSYETIPLTRAQFERLRTIHYNLSDMLKVR